MTNEVKIDNSKYDHLGYLAALNFDVSFFSAIKPSTLSKIFFEKKIIKLKYLKLPFSIIKIGANNAKIILQ